MFGRPDPLFPVELRSLTGVGKQQLLDLRQRVRIGLMHSSDEPYTPQVPLRLQMQGLNAMAIRILGPVTDKQQE